MKFTEAITKYLAWRQFSVRQQTTVRSMTELRLWCLTLGNPDVESITHEDVIGHLNLMKELGYGSTALHERSLAIRQFMKYLKDMEFKVITHELIPDVPREFKFPKVITDEQFKQLIAIIPDNNDPRHIRNKALLYLLYDTGMRSIECLNLNLEDIDLEEMKAVIKTAKNRGSKPFRQIMWTKTTNDLLFRWIDTRQHILSLGLYEKEQALFIGVSGSKVGARLQRTGLGALIRHYSVKAGLPNMNAHRFRHHMGRDLVMKGANNTTISQILGHANIASSQIYTALDDKALEEQYRKYKGY